MAAWPEGLQHPVSLYSDCFGVCLREKAVIRSDPRQRRPRTAQADWGRGRAGARGLLAACDFLQPSRDLRVGRGETPGENVPVETFHPKPREKSAEPQWVRMSVRRDKLGPHLVCLCALLGPQTVGVGPFSSIQNGTGFVVPAWCESFG